MQEVYRNCNGENFMSRIATIQRRLASSNLRVFVSHCVDDKKFVFEVCDLLNPYLGPESMFLFEEWPALDEPFMRKIDAELVRAHVVLMFVGNRFDKYMDYEAIRTSTMSGKIVCIVDIGGRKDVKDMPDTIRDHLAGLNILIDNYSERVPPDAVRCAKDILEKLRQCDVKRNYPFFQNKSLVWNDEHLRYGLPEIPYVFDYEKDIIRFYLANRCYEYINQEIGEKEAGDIRNRYHEILEAWPEEKVRETLKRGIAAAWPSVYRYKPTQRNTLHQDKFRGASGESFLRVNALVGLDVPGDPLVFLEAGPRPNVALPKDLNLTVAIVVAGGIAPGINAVIDASVQRHYAYHRASNQRYNLEVIGLKNGLLAIQESQESASHMRRLTPNLTVEHATRGGSMLGTSRDETLLSSDPKARWKRIEVIARELRRRNVDVLYIIGGDGSMKAAHALWHKASSDSGVGAKQMSVVAIPKTMDNDILWVWQSFGFLSAVQEAREIIERLHTEVRSNPRLGIVQFFGSGSGFVVSHAVLAAATGHTTLALIPEMDFSVIGIARYIKQRLWEAACPSDVDSADPAAPIDPTIPHGLIVMAETAIPLDALECLGLKDPPDGLKEVYQAVASILRASRDEEEAIKSFFDNGRRVQGQTSDYLRSLGIKLLYELLPTLIKHPRLNEMIVDTPAWNEPSWKKLRMVRNEPRYLVRALEPFTTDIITGQRLGLLAVDAAMAGYTDCMVSQWLTEFTIVPLELVVLGRKRIPPSGMFWKSVTAKTRQPADLVSPYPKPDPKS
jgi:6-phosphofructokinase